MTETSVPKAEKTGDDKSINFRPSPNFKHMKKYLKYKFEEAGCSAASNSQISDHGSSIQVDKKVNVVVQPPLPPNTPPPDYPPKFMVKKEIMDDGYENIAKTDNEELHEEHESKPTIQMEGDDKPKKKEMCRDFARGNCTWNPCRKSHELDLSQLEGVYDFCKDFANGKCRRPNCRFVHATTFEKESYFRTGDLPPHLRPNIRKKKDKQLTQPQQQQILVATAPVQPMSTMSMPVDPMASTSDFRASCAPPLPPVMSIPPAMDPGMYNMFLPPPPQPPPPVTPPPQPIPDFSECGHIQREVEESAPKSCARCKISEMRYEENLMELEKVEQSTLTIKEQIELLDQRKAKLLAILTKVLWKDVPKYVREARTTD